VNKDGPHACLEDDKHPKTARLPLTRARNPLLNNPATQIRSNQTSLRIQYRPAQGAIQNAGLVNQTGKGLRFEDAHPMNHYNTACYSCRKPTGATSARM
jgi:hypothetical protein